MNIHIIPKWKFTNELIQFISNNSITELEEIEYFYFFNDYSGIIFYIPEEKIYGCETVWFYSEEMLLKFGTYKKYLNQIMTDLEKEYFKFIEFNEEIKSGKY